MAGPCGTSGRVSRSGRFSRAKALTNQVTPAMEAFTKEVFSGPGLQSQGQGPQEWQDQQALYSSKGTTVYMNEGKPKGRQKEQGKKRAAARAGPASANGGDGEL